MTPLETQYQDRFIDEINAFHRDELKPQRAKVRAIVKAKSDGGLDEALRAGAQVDPDFVPDQARRDAREFLLAQYAPGEVQKRLKS